MFIYFFFLTVSVVGSVEFGFNGDTEPTTPFGVGVSGGTGEFVFLSSSLSPLSPF